MKHYDPKKYMFWITAGNSYLWRNCKQWKKIVNPMPEHLSGSIWLYSSLFRKYDLAKFGKAMKQKRFIFCVFSTWGWYTTLFTIMKELGLYFWGRLCTEAY